MTFWDGQRWVEDAPRRPQLPDRVARFRDTLATLIIVVAVVGTATVIAPVEAGSPTLWTSPIAATVGSAVTANGRGFPSKTSIQLLWDGSAAGMPSVAANGGGNFAAIFIVPQASIGAHAITTSVVATGRKAFTLSTSAASTRRTVTSATFTVVDPSGAATPGPDPTADLTTPAPVPSLNPTDPPTAPPDPTQSPTDPPVDPTPRPTPDPTPKPTPKPTPDPTDPPPPASDIPAMPAADLLRKSFANGTLGPFRPIAYINDHPGNPMGYACDYKTGTGVISVHDGYLDVRAKPGTGDRWDCGYLSTGMDGNGHPATFSFTTGYLQFATRVNVGYATWQDPLWLSNSVSCWCSAEIDAAEVISGRLTFNIHGPANLQVASHSVPANLDTTWHIFGIAKARDHVTFTMDGNVLGTWHGSMPDPMALMIDSKVGIPWESVYPNAQTPRPTYAHVAWVTVSSHIPSGL